MAVTLRLLLSLIPVSLVLATIGCSEPRRDPCALLSVQEIRDLDARVTTSVWSGRDEPRREDEVCVYHSADGEPRVMLFAWYDASLDPNELLAAGVRGRQAAIVTVPASRSTVRAAFAGGELKLLALKSSSGIVGLRVRKPVLRDSRDLDIAVSLAETASSRL